MARALGWLYLAAVACAGAQRAPLAKAGEAGDEGGGDLARQSMQLALGTNDVESSDVRARSRAGYGGDTYGGELYGGGTYGGDPYGGASYAGWTIPQWSYSTPNRNPHYGVAASLTSAIVGTVTWPGAAPGKLLTACGPIDNPTLHVGSDHGVRGALVYIEKVSVGRQVPYYGRPASVGGVVAKHGCALLPSAQIITPLPTSLAIYGDATRARVRTSLGGTPVKAFELQEGGVVEVEAKPGITRIDGEDGKLVSAWVLALDTPYYAVTDESGRFRIDELAPGTYDLTFWQPPIATTGADATISYGAPIVVHRTVKLEVGKTARIDLALR